MSGMQSIILAIFGLAILGSSTTASPNCPDDGLALSGDSQNCSIYYICLNGEIMEQRICPNGGHFSEELEKCTDPETARCRVEDPLCPEDVPLGLVPHPSDCSKYYICVEGEGVERNCPEGEHFSPTELTCMAPELAKCDAIWNVCPNDTLSLQPHPSNCSKYFICDQGEAIEQDCPDGLHFSNSTKNCTDPSIAQCEGLSTLPPSTTENPDTTENPVTTTEGPTDEPGSTTTPQPGTSTDEPSTTSEPSSSTIPPPECNPGDDFLAPHEDCSKFYICFDGDLNVMDCPAGLHFNPEIGTCDFPENVNCDRR